MAEYSTETTTRRARPTVEQKRNIKAAYLKGQGSIRQLSKQFGLCVDTVNTWCFDEKWVELRKLFNERAEERFMAPTAPEPTETKEAQEQEPDRARTVLGQIESIDLALKSATDPLDLSRLADAKSKLWSLLYPKPARARGRNRTSFLAEVSPESAPEPVESGFRVMPEVEPGQSGQEETPQGQDRTGQD